MDVNTKVINPRPFLRWAGGKSWLTKNISKFIPFKINNYHEPFLGSAAIFIHLKNNNLISGHSYLSDTNHDLIIAYKVIQSNVTELISKLKKFENTSENYYKIRDSKPISDISKAARFIFLNRTSYNGIYRVNREGQYNVPYGSKTYIQLFDYENLIALSKVFENVEFETYDFSESLKFVQSNDLVFIDPPYTIAHGNNGFIKYNQKLFAWEDQVRLLEFVNEIVNRGANYILTNAFHSSIHELFSLNAKEFVMERLNVIGGKGAERNYTKEYLFTNIEKILQVSC
jgi:DNA adenine methylase